MTSTPGNLRNIEKFIFTSEVVGPISISGILQLSDLPDIRETSEESLKLTYCKSLNFSTEPLFWWELCKH